MQQDDSKREDDKKPGNSAGLKRKRATRNSKRAADAPKRQRAGAPQRGDDEEDHETDIEDQQPVQAKPSRKSSSDVVSDRKSRVPTLAHRLAQEVVLSEGGEALLPAQLFVRATLGLVNNDPIMEDEWPAALELKELSPLVRRENGVVYVPRSLAMNFLRALANESGSRKGLRWLVHLDVTSRRWHEELFNIVDPAIRDAQAEADEAEAKGAIQSRQPFLSASRQTTSPAAVRTSPPQSTVSPAATPSTPTPQGSTLGEQASSLNDILKYHITCYRNGEMTAEQVRASLELAESPKIKDDVIARFMRRLGASTPGQAMGRPMPASMSEAPQVTAATAASPGFTTSTPKADTQQGAQPTPQTAPAGTFSPLPLPLHLTHTAETPPPTASPATPSMVSSMPSTAVRPPRGADSGVVGPTLYSFEGEPGKAELIRKAAAYAAPLLKRKWELAREALRAARLMMKPGKGVDAGLVGVACLMLPLFEPQGRASVEDMAIEHCASLGAALGTPLTEQNRQLLVQLGWIARRYFSAATAGPATTPELAASHRAVVDAFAFARENLVRDPIP